MLRRTFPLSKADFQWLNAYAVNIAFNISEIAHYCTDDNLVTEYFLYSSHLLPLWHHDLVNYVFRDANFVVGHIQDNIV